jgi:hypothetical protein
MATKYAVASGNWSSTATWSDSDGGAGGAAVPVNLDVVVISAGVIVTFDVDMSAFTNGINGLTIRGGVTPGMLRFKWDAAGTYHLKIRSAPYTISGTTSTNRGRLLANGTGTWGDTTPLPFGCKAIIDLTGTATSAKIDASNLDIQLYCTQPTRKYVTLYGTKVAVTGVDTGTGYLTTASAHGWAANTAVALRSSGTLPQPLVADVPYKIDTALTSSLKLKWIGDNPLYLDSTGSGTIEVFSGPATSATTVNVFEDVTTDPAWTTVDGHDFVTLLNRTYATSVDRQRVQLTTINAGSLVLTTATDSAQNPASRLYLLSRNVSIRWSGTSVSANVVDFGSATHSGVFQCEIRATAAGASGTTTYGYGIAGGSGHLISGCLTGFQAAVRQASSVILTGVLTGNVYGTESCPSLTMSGDIVGNTTAGLYNSTSANCTGTFFANGTALKNCTSATLNGPTFIGGDVMTGGVNTTVTDVTMLGVNNGLAGNRFALTNVVSHGAYGFALSQAMHASGTFTSVGCYTVAVSSGWLNLTVNCDQNYDGFSMSYGVVQGTISRAANTGLYACPQLQFTGSVQNPLAAVSGSGPTRIDLRGVTLTGSTYGINGNNQADITGYQVKITAPTRVQLALTPASNLVALWPNRVFLFDPVAADDTVKWGYIECHTPGGYTKTSDYSAGTHGTPPVTLAAVHESWFQWNETWQVVEWSIPGYKNTPLLIDLYYRATSTADWTIAPELELCDYAKGFKVSGEQLQTTGPLVVSDTNWHATQLSYTPANGSFLKLRFAGKGGNATRTGTGGMYWWAAVSLGSGTVTPPPATPLWLGLAL